MSFSVTKMTQIKPSLIAVMMGVIAFLWTAPGESSDPVLKVSELPSDVRGACGFVAVVEPPPACIGEQDFQQRWISKTSDGHLFLLTYRFCNDPNSCRAWVLEKKLSGVSTLLSIEGNYRLQRGKHRYPIIQVHTVLSDSQSIYRSFEWIGEAYARTDSKLVYQVDGAECGTVEECDHLARTAAENKEYGKAVEIWETVHGVSWI